MAHQPREDAAGFDAHAGTYHDAVQHSIDFSGLDHAFFTRRKATHLLDLAARLVGPVETLRALDVGCGVGETDGLLAGRFAELEGIDTAKEALRRAAAANPAVRYRVYDGSRLPYDDGTFDVALASCVFHHIPHDEHVALLGEIRRVLGPGGRLFVFEHNPLNPLTRHAVNTCEFDEHAQLVLAPTMRRRVRDAGFATADVRYRIFFPHALRRLRPLEARMTWLPLGAQYYVVARKES